MTTTMLAEKQTTVRSREYVVGIYRERGQLVVRKFLFIGEQKVPVDESYALDIDHAIWTQNLMINQIHQFRLN